MNRVAILSCLLIVLVLGDMASAISWPAYPGSNGIRSSVCQKKLGCGSKNLATKGVCKAFCLGRKRFWEKCGKNGKSGGGSKICNPVLAHAVEKAGKGLIKVTDMAVAAIIKYAGKK